MPADKQSFSQSMKPWPTLLEFSNQLFLPKQALNIFYFEAGKHNQRHLLMLHGLGDEADTWRHVFHQLAENFHVFAPDLPGFGRSDKPDRDYTPQFLMGAVIDFLDQLAIDRVILMGSSLGGILAHGMPLAYPERIQGLILVGGSVLGLEGSKDRGFQLMQIPLLGEWLYTRLRKYPNAAFNSLKNVYYNLELLPEADREFLFTRVNQRVWSDGQRRAYFSTLRNLIPWIKQIQRKLPEQLSTLRIPTLIIRGAHDVLFLEISADRLVNLQPKTNKVTIEGAGHLPHQECPVKFMQVVNQWLLEKF